MHGPLRIFRVYENGVYPALGKVVFHIVGEAVTPRPVRVCLMAGIPLQADHEYILHFVSCREKVCAQGSALIGVHSVIKDVIQFVYFVVDESIGDSLFFKFVGE